MCGLACRLHLLPLIIDFKYFLNTGKYSVYECIRVGGNSPTLVINDTISYINMERLSYEYISALYTIDDFIHLLSGAGNDYDTTDNGVHASVQN